jgi:hypothetical protein
MNKHKGGRPPNPSTPQIKARICLEIAEGKSLRNICLADDMPALETVRVWLALDAEFSVQYARAREEQADYYADEIIEIADTAEDANLARLRIDARKWKASKLRPKKYGEKLDLTSEDGSMSPKPGIDASKLSTETLAEIMRAADASKRS